LRGKCEVREVKEVKQMEAKVEWDVEEVHKSPDRAGRDARVARGTRADVGPSRRDRNLDRNCDCDRP
jgi:hypothetical protein